MCGKRGDRFVSGELFWKTLTDLCLGNSECFSTAGWTGARKLFMSNENRRRLVYRSVRPCQPPAASTEVAPPGAERSLPEGAGTTVGGGSTVAVRDWHIVVGRPNRAGPGKASMSTPL